MDTIEIENTATHESQNKLVQKLIDNEDEQGLMAVVEERVNNEKFRQMNEYRDELYATLEEIKAKIDVAKGRVARDNGMKLVSYVEARGHTVNYREVYEELAFVNRVLKDFRSVTAQAIFSATEIREANQKANGTFLTYDFDTIADLVAGGEYESGSPEWHEQRLSGIGGSDVKKIMKSDPKYGTRDYRDILLEKSGIPSDENNDEGRDDFTTAAGIGNAWEEAIRHMYADKHPEKNIAFCKTSWEGVGAMSYVHANFDGLELDDKGNPTGIIEIKTGVHTDKWGDTSDGFTGMPTGYRQQAVWYAGNAKLHNVTLVAVLDDYDYREYTFTMDDPRAKAEWEKMQSDTAEFWKIVENNRAELKSGINNVSSIRRSGFAKTVNMKQAAKKISAYSGDSFDSVYEKVREEFAKLTKVNGAYTKEQIQNALTKVYATYNPNLRNKPLIGIDIETNSASPKQGRIIETGIVSLSANGETEVLFSTIHGVSEKTIKGVGVGLTEIHRITEDMLVNKKTFEDKETQKEILKHLTSGVIVAHNATFEKEFLAVNLDGFAEALDNGEIQFLDTKQIVTNLMLDSEDNSLNSFAEDNGVPYAGAHAATTDTIMMMDALRNFQVSLHKNGKFKSKRITKKSRNTAEKEAVAYDLTR